MDGALRYLYIPFFSALYYNQIMQNMAFNRLGLLSCSFYLLRVISLLPKCTVLHGLHKSQLHYNSTYVVGSNSYYSTYKSGS